jgi:uncharacterized protein with PQ loop repeat
MTGELVTIVGLTAAACTTASFVPQVIHILRTRQVAGISGIMYSVFCVGVLLWTIYGVAIGSTPVILAKRGHVRPCRDRFGPQAHVRASTGSIDRS